MRAYVETPPAAEPISAEQAANWLRLDEDVADVDAETLASLITAAREYCENYCDRAIAAQTWGVVLDELAEVQLPGGPVREIVSIDYVDAAGTDKAVPAEVYTLTRDGRLRLNTGQQWPDHKTGPDSVSITYKVGSDTVPADVVMAMRLLIGHYYENRRGVVIGASVSQLPLGVEAHLIRHREMSL